MRFYLFVILSLFFYSCVSGQKESTSTPEDQEFESMEEEFNYLDQLEQDIIGEWTNVSMRVWVRTYNNSDTSFIVDISEENWELKMNIKPIITTIYEDGTYISEFRNSFDSLIYKPEGSWFIDGDTLIMEDHQEVYKYQVFIDGDLAEFKSKVDWDKDGKADDEYFGIQHKTR